MSELRKRIAPEDPGHRVKDAADEIGLREGVVVPMRSMDGSLGLVVLGGDREDMSHAEMEFLVSISRTAFDAAERIQTGERAGRASPILSFRELECVRLIARGYSDRKIGTLLSISEPTVRFHIRNARDKFAAISRTHLAALVISHGYTSI